MTIRRVTADDYTNTSFPLLTYAFYRSPVPAGRADEQPTAPAYLTGNRTLVAEEDGETLATASAIPMRQNLHGTVRPTAGVAGVTTHPLARRRGLVRTLLHQLLDEMRDEGHQLSALYPFRPSFYARFGYTGLPAPRTVTFSPANLGPLLRADLPGEVTWTRIGAGYPAYQEFLDRYLHHRHGFAVFPEYRAVRFRDDDDRWLAAARVDGHTVGTLTYRIDGHGGDLVGDELLTTDAYGRALLLQFLSRHVDQVARTSVRVPPDELPELWLTDLDVQIEAKAAGPDCAAPMARLLTLDALTGLPAGPGRVRIELTGDRWLAGEHLLDGGSGTLEVTPAKGPVLPVGGSSTAAGGSGTPVATLTAAGLSALAYGVLDPVEVQLNGLGTVPVDAAEQLRRIFPRAHPYLCADF